MTQEDCAFPTDSNIDVYTGWIVAYIDRAWRKVHIAPGYCTLAADDKPNEHLAICRLEDVLAGSAKGEKIDGSRNALIGAEIVDNDILDRIAFVRFGRTKRLNFGHKRLVDGELLLAIERNLDDQNGIISGWPRYPAQKTRA